MTIQIQKCKLNLDSSQIEVLGPKNREISPKKLRSFIFNAFLPNNYPNSVSKDYLTYQIFDTLQALCSSLNGSLATYATLKTVGVGNSEASILSSTLSWLLRDGTGMISSIFFTYFKSSDLDYNPKQWRLVADISNDIAMMIDLVAKNPYVLCFSAIFRAICGVAGSATRMQIILHQTNGNDNLGDIAAKDGAQETLVNLVGLCLNLYLVPILADRFYVLWAFFLVFVFLHISFNYCGVRAVKSRILNQNRLNVILEQKIYDIKQVNDREPIFNFFNPFRKYKYPDFKIGQGFTRSSSFKNKILHKIDDKIIITEGNLNIYQDAEITNEEIIFYLILMRTGYKIDKAEEILVKIKEAGWVTDRIHFLVGNVRIKF